MGEGVELEDVSAKFEDGILRVSLPKKEQNRLAKSNLIVIFRLHTRKLINPVRVQNIDWDGFCLGSIFLQKLNLPFTGITHIGGLRFRNISFTSVKFFCLDKKFIYARVCKNDPQPVTASYSLISLRKYKRFNPVLR